MSAQQIRPYGSWPSPITSDLIVSKTVGLGEITLTGTAVYWLEMRPEDEGRSVIVQCMPDGTTKDVNPPPFNARNRVHEYGGGSYVIEGDTVYFAHFDDQRWYRVAPGGGPSPITPAGDFRFADAVMDRARGRLICIREDHGRGTPEPVNELVAVGVHGACGAVTVLAAGADFYSNPRLSPDGRRLCWLCWHHPNMPWDGTELWLAEIGDDGTPVDHRRIAGGPEESVFQPEWSPDGRLYFVSDRSGWWQLYRWSAAGIAPEVRRDAEFGVPQWTFRQSTYAFATPERIISSFIENGIHRLAAIDIRTGALTVIETPYTEIESLHADARRAVFLAASPRESPGVVELDLASRKCRSLRRASSIDIDPRFISEGVSITFPTENNQSAHGFYYPPVHAHCAGPVGEKPPLLVISHGGPTSATHNGLKLLIQFFTSRGFAVLDVNYGGSSGYGRAYRRRLHGRWGVVDVDDCVNGALYLADRGEVDRKRLAIRGGSAGGFTTLAALTFRDVFRAGASRYGVSDLETLARDTHKFESRYLESLIGPYPDTAEEYRRRSPIHAVERLSCPIIFFQGLDDKIVPPSQTEKMVAALRNKGLPVAYLAYAGEQHGFRRARNIKRTLDAELYFYSRVFCFEPADFIEPVNIDNLAPDA